MVHTDVIRALLSNDNTVRRQAESTYTQIKAHQPMELATTLLTLTCFQTNSTDVETRMFAPVLLRRLVETEGLPNDATYRAQMKTQLLATLVQETQPPIRRKVSHVVAQVARQDASWPELLPSIVQLTQHPDPGMQVTALDVLATLAEYTGAKLKLHHEQLGNVFASFVASPTACTEARVAAWKALSAFVVHLESSDSLQPFSHLLPPFLQLLEGSLQNHDEVAARELLTSFLAMTEVHPSLLMLHLDLIGNAMLSTAQARSLSTDTRTLALECLLALFEHATQLFRSSKALLEAVVPCLLALLAELDDVPAWVDQFDDHKDEGTGVRVCDAGAGAIDRVAHSVGGKVLVPLIMPYIAQYLEESTSWQRQHAALFALGLMAEGSKDYLFQVLDVWLPRILDFLQHPHPRIRHAALFCVGQFARDFGVVARGKNFQTKYHGQVLPALLPLLSDAVMRNRGSAASVMSNFCHPEHCRTQYILAMLDPILSALFQALQTSPRQVQEQAITAVACVAKVVGDAFVLHYSVFMPVAAHLLTQSQGKQYALLRGKAMECVALIGQAVGKEAFLNDAKAVMDILLRHETDDSGVELQYLTQACVRIASVLQEDFVAYLPLIVPKLLQQAATKPDVVLVDWNDETAATDDDDDDDEHDGIHEIVVDVQGQGKKKLQIQTSALQGKELGLNMLYQLALDLKGAFVAYVEPALNVVLPLLKFQYLDTVRMLSGLTLAKLLEAAIAGSVVTSTAPHQVLELIFEPLLTALIEEGDLECIVGLSEAVASVLEATRAAADNGYRMGIPLAHLPTVFDKLLAVSHASVLRRVQNLSDSADDDEEEVNAEDEEAILQNVVDAIGWTIKQYKHDIVPLFVEHVAPVVNPYLEPSFPAVIRAHFICIIDDILEFGGAAVPPIMPTLLTHLWNSLEDTNPCAIRAAAYGAGICAQHGGMAFEPHCVPTLQRVWTCIQALEHDRVETEQAAARDNCVSAVGKFCLYRAHLVDAPTLLGLWLNCLPLQSDAIEARAVHADLVTMVERSNMDLLGENYVHLALVLKKFADILALDLDEEFEPVLEDETKARLTAVLQHIQATYPPAIVQSAWSSLSEDDQQVFASLQ
ncbi:hypothetical protein H310_12945 [Aphanomyces invadans]|uniref:IPO4/5-like TPR repeats domain-containing protein n=1 Tax=Aphanomyces invadans TaxID=157072 RepID=A0A024TFZ3_9STRA|nr:hypothetical protein H310_12945 [Aphanomyces invadans]ETV92948.1 hypothetical protein H310_12945 [Aphanomyces invadans]|eukprot:XP_008878469.1 hypothetical protein H310_12945 [Aphanomyces invadans]